MKITLVAMVTSGILEMPQLCNSQLGQQVWCGVSLCLRQACIAGGRARAVEVPKLLGAQKISSPKSQTLSYKIWSYTEGL